MTLSIVFVFVLGYILLGLIEPYLIGVAIDDFISTKQAAGLARTSIVLLIVFLFDNGFQAISSWMMARVSQDALKHLRRDLFGHLQTLSLKFFDEHTAGELMSRLTNDIEAVNQAVSQNVVSLFASTLSMIGILIAMFVLNPWLAMAAVVVVPVMFWFANFIARYTRKGFRELQKRLGQINGVMEETISGQHVVKAFGRSESAIENFPPLQSRSLQGWHLRQQLCPGAHAAHQRARQPVRHRAGRAGRLSGLAGTGYYRHDRCLYHLRAQLYQSPAPACQYVQLAPGGAGGGGAGFRDHRYARGSGRIQTLLRLPPFKEKSVSTNVDFGYLPGTKVIKGMTLEAKAGQTIALVGPTGAGKTTLINLLMRFYEVGDGCISIDGRDLREIPKSDLRRKLGLVLQDTFLFSDTVMENIRYGRLDATDDEVIQAAQLADADHFIRLLPQGYQTMLSERASNLSQGQRQMLSIARAILADPAILILDEATSSVDTRTEVRIQKALLRLMEGRTSFVIAHRLSTIRDADKVVVINNGEIVEQGQSSAVAR